VENGLIDGVADRDEVFRMAAEAAGLGEGEQWAVRRIDVAEPGLLSLLGARADDEATIEAPAQRPAMCLGSGVLLAWHGDPAQLCQPAG
jgi:ClpP class serine protease